jgi:hypothetical protein
MRTTSAALSIVLGTALAMLTLDGVSRWYYTLRTVRDPVLGFVVPAGHVVRSRTEGAGLARYEGRGVRRAKGLGPATGARILCIGDSFTEALQVSDEEVYTTLTERALNRAALATAVLNFGRSGGSVADYIANASVHKEIFTPHWTVVEVDEGDFTSDAWQPAKTHFRRRCPDCALEVATIPPVPDDAPHRAYTWLTNHSALAGFAWVSWQTHVSFSRRSDAAIAADEQASENPLGREAFPVAEELRMLADAYVGRLTLLLLGTFDPAHPGLDTDGEAAIKRAAQQLGISIACSKDVYPSLAERGTAPRGFGNTALNTGHMNRAGHAAAARVLAAELLRLHGAGRL